MPSTQIKDILEQIRSIHHKISQYYTDLSEHETDERSELLLKYLARHEENFNEALGRYEQDAAQGVLETWLQFAAEETVDETLQTFELAEGMSPDEIIRLAMIFDRKLIKLYRELADSTEISSVSELFSNLILMEDSKNRQYARSLQEYE